MGFFGVAKATYFHKGHQGSTKDTKLDVDERLILYLGAAFVHYGVAWQILE